MRTNLYWDGDGIFNVNADHSYVQAPADATGWSEWHHITVPGAFPGYWSRDAVQEVNSIARTPGVVNKWLTSREEQAPQLLAPAIGLNAVDWEVLYGLEEDDPMNWHWWKLDKLRKDLDRDRPDRFIWFDDDITSDPAALKWLKATGLPHLVIVPKIDHGLTRAHLDAVREFLDQQ